MTSDWLITSLEDRGVRSYYRYRVSGENLNVLPDDAGHTFTWCVPSITNPRYAAHPASGPAVHDAVEAAKRRTS